jgi:hypothetical protein
MDPDEELRPIYQMILDQKSTWADLCQPSFIPESDPQLDQWAETPGKIEQWIENARLIAVSRQKLVSEDSPDVCESETSAEYSDNGEELTGMYTAGMFNEEGKPALSRAHVTEEQTNRLRNRGMAGGPATVSGAGRQGV